MAEGEERPEMLSGRSRVCVYPPREDRLPMARARTLTAYYPRAYALPPRQQFTLALHDRGDACALSVANNGTVAMLEGLLIVGIVGVLLYWRSGRCCHGQQPHPALNAGRWRTAHYDV